jgi:hypothetical protein
MPPGRDLHNTRNLTRGPSIVAIYARRLSENIGEVEFHV